MERVTAEKYSEAGENFGILDCYKDIWDYRDGLYSQAEEYLAEDEYDKAIECFHS